MMIFGVILIVTGLFNLNMAIFGMNSFFSAFLAVVSIGLGSLSLWMWSHDND